MTLLKQVHIETNPIGDRLALEFDDRMLAADFNETMSAHEVAARLRALAAAVDPKSPAADALTPMTSTQSGRSASSGALPAD